MSNIINFANFVKSNNEINKDNNIIISNNENKEIDTMNTISTTNTFNAIPVRTSTFANIGTTINTSSTVEEALKEAHLNYDVHKTPVYTNGVLIPDSYATCPTYDNGQTYGNPFGIVSNKYQVIQNNEAFGFIDCIPDLEFKKIGTTKGGMIYFIGELPNVNILGDDYNPYLIFRNSHNGRYNLQVTICPLRIVCQNQFNIAFKESPNTITIRHSRQAPAKIEEARRVIVAHGEYYKNLKIQAEEWATQHIGIVSIQQIIDELFPIKNDMKDYQRERMEESRHLFNKALNANDNQNFKNSVWGMINAYSDYITHREPARRTETANENRFMSVTFDPSIMNSFIQLVQSKIAA